MVVRRCPEIDDAALPVDRHETRPFTECLCSRIRFEHQPCFESAAPVQRQTSPQFRTEDIVTVRAAGTRQREWLEASQNVDHVYHLLENFMVQDERELTILIRANAK